MILSVSNLANRKVTRVVRPNDNSLLVRRRQPVAFLFLQHLGPRGKRIGVGSRIASVSQENAREKRTSVDVALLFGEYLATRSILI